MIEIARESDSKLVLAGDPAQLSPIGAGGLFGELKDNVPTAQLSEVHRANHQWERDAWQQLRQGDAERALGEYHARGRLHIEETRTEAGERMVDDWAATRAAHPGERVVMLTDASNQELDRLNQQAQEQRANAGELGPEEVTLPDRPYGLRSGDEIVFARQHRIRGEQRVENGTRGQVMAVNERESRLVVRTDEPRPRAIDISTREFDGLRLAYAQHVYKAQGLTTDRALVLTGGWQTDRETAYVALTRARERTDIYTSSEDLGHQGIDAHAINRLAERASQSNTQEASLSRESVEPDREPGGFARELREAPGRDRPHERERDGREQADADERVSRAVRELREALARDRPHEQEREGREQAEADEPVGRAVSELREALGRDEPRERDSRAESDREPSTFVEELRRIEREQREHEREHEHDRDNDHSHGFEL